MRYFKKIAGEKIYLSPMNIDDAGIYTKWMNDNEVSGNLSSYPHAVSYISERRSIEQLSTNGQNFAIVMSENDYLIGNISLMNIDHLNRTANVGLFIGEADKRNNGYGSEALRLILEYGFNTLNLHNIMLRVNEDNTAALTCFKKLGFKEFGRRKEAKFKDGRYIDVVYMEILSEVLK